MNHHATIDSILRMFDVAGRDAYFGEAVSQTEHALQSANLAVNAGADAELVVAAVLHDIGHMLRGLPENASDHGIDDVHEHAGATWLARHFGPGVVMPVRLHVAAKRYLCTVDADYHSSLSPQSQISLKLQGGPFNADEVRAFEAETFYQQAVALRRWDDSAKIPGLPVPELEFYLPMIQSALERGGKSHAIAL